MKRCPECGFRANDTKCPLCGVRMQDLPEVAQALRTHTHQQSGERCVLPNQKMPKKPEATRPQTVVQPHMHPEMQQQKKKEAKPVKSGLLKAIFVVIIVVLFRACAG